jgi:hypothetical protein
MSYDGLKRRAFLNCYMLVARVKPVAGRRGSREIGRLYLAHAQSVCRAARATMNLDNPDTIVRVVTVLDEAMHRMEANVVDFIATIPPSP